MMAPSKDQVAVAILTSGGVESAALVAEAVRRYERVYPIYIRKGFVWETAELAHLKWFLRVFRSDGLAPLTVLEVPLTAVYKPHWSLGKNRVPGFWAPDSAVYLPGRNLLLLSLAGLFCGLRKIPVLWIGVLRGNPFQDARDSFLVQMERVLEESLGAPIRIEAPFKERTKSEVIRRHRGVPWEQTFSCLNPTPVRRRMGGGGGRHCGRCQKCAERQAGFRKAGVKDPTRYRR